MKNVSKDGFGWRVATQLKWCDNSFGRLQLLFCFYMLHLRVTNWTIVTFQMNHNVVWIERQQGRKNVSQIRLSNRNFICSICSSKIRLRPADQFFKYTITTKHALYCYKITTQEIKLCTSKSICIVLNRNTNVFFFFHVNEC